MWADALPTILTWRRIDAWSSFGCTKHVIAVSKSRRCTCFSEIPRGMLDRLVKRYSMLGIGFRQATVISSGWTSFAAVTVSPVPFRIAVGPIKGLRFSG